MDEDNEEGVEPTWFSHFTGTFSHHEEGKAPVRVVLRSRPTNDPNDFAFGVVDKWILVHGGGFPYPVLMRIGRDRNNRLQVSGLIVDRDSVLSWLCDDVHFPIHSAELMEELKEPVSITTTSLRKVAREVSSFMHMLEVYRLEFDEHVEWSQAFIGLMLTQECAVPHSGVAVRPGRRGFTPEHYRQIGEEFLAAREEDPDHPFSLLSRRRYLSESQTRRAVKKAWELFPELKPKEDTR